MWNVPILAPNQFAKKNQVLEQYCKDINRDCSEIERSYLTPMYLNPDPEAMKKVLQRAVKMRGMTEEEAQQTFLAGTPDEIRTQLQAYIDIGVTHFIINLRRPGLYDERRYVSLPKRSCRLSVSHSYDFHFIVMYFCSCFDRLSTNENSRQN